MSGSGPAGVEPAPDDASTEEVPATRASAGAFASGRGCFDQDISNLQQELAKLRRLEKENVGSTQSKSSAKKNGDVDYEKAKARLDAALSGSASSVDNVGVA